MTSAQPVLLDVDNLRVHFFTDEGVVKAVEGVSLKVRYGSILGIVGESGCGKSVTARAVLQVVAAPGRIVGGTTTLYRRYDHQLTRIEESIVLTDLKADGREIQRIRGKEIAMVFQEPMSAFSPVHTIGSQIAEALLLHSDMTKEQARAETIAVLGRVGMPSPESVVDRFPYELSGGMCQRAMIGMALSCTPRLLIADEPTTALDVTTQAQILELLSEMQQRLGMAIMYITHDMGVIAQICEEVCVMYLGRVVEQASVDALFQDAKHPYTRALLRSIPRLGHAEGSELEAISGNVPDPYNLPTGCTFHPRCPSFMAGVCDEREPAVVDLGDGHTVTCVLYEEELSS